LTRPRSVRYSLAVVRAKRPSSILALPLLLLPSAALGDARVEHRAEREAFERLTADLVAQLARPPAGSGSGQTGALRLRDRLPPELVSLPVPGGRPDAPPPPGGWPALPDGVLEPARYDLPVRYNRHVAAWVGWFLGRGRPSMARWLARKGRYEALITDSLREHGLPQDLIWLVLIESGFDPHAVSRASATGLWQFMEATAADYGLVVDRWVDERRSPEKSTAAGCQYLKYLHRRFASWELAMGAYNTGVGLVSEAVRRYNTNDFWTVTSYAYLPSGTRLYVAKVYAAAIVGKHAEAFGFGGVVPERPAAVVGVTVDGGTRLKRLARAAGVRRDVMEALNPELVRARVPPEADDWEVWVPADRFERFTKRYDRGARARKPIRHHVVRFGETLRDVARAYGVRRRVLRVLNGLEPKTAVQPGATLRVPVPPKRRPKPVAKPDPLEPVVFPALGFDYPGQVRVLVRVKRGYGLQRIAHWVGVPPAQLAMWNGLDPAANLLPGMVLRAWVAEGRDLSDVLLVDPTHVRIVVADSEEFAAAHGQARRDRERRRGPKAGRRVHYTKHTVRRGETLSKIARRYRTTLEAILRINRINPNRLRPGQVLRIRRGARR